MIKTEYEQKKENKGMLHLAAYAMKLSKKKNGKEQQEEK